MSNTYRGLDYLQNVIGEVIDLGITVDNTIEFELKYNITQISGNYTTILGARQYPDFKGFLFFPRYGSSNTFGAQLGGTVQQSMTFQLNVDYTAMLRASNKILRIRHHNGTNIVENNVSCSSVLSTTYSYPKVNMWLFSGNSCYEAKNLDEVVDPCSAKIYYCKIWKNKELVRDLIPMMRLSDGVCGMFDLVSKTFMISRLGNISAFSGNTNNVYYDEEGKESNSFLQNKIRYAIETKELIREKLNEKGCNISESDSFRSYVDKINNISTGESSELEITNATSLFTDNVRLDSLEELLKICKNVTSTKRMFYGCSDLQSLDISGLNTSQSTDMSYMFYDCSNLTALDISGFDSSKTTTLSNMFNRCQKLKALDFSNFDISNVTDTSYMFYICSSLESLDLSSFGANKITKMSNMFAQCTKLKTLNVSNLNTSNVTDMSYTFASLGTSGDGLTDLDLSSFDMSKVNNIRDIFYYLTSLTNFTSFKNLGKGYTQKSTNYTNYKLDLNKSTNLTHDSLIDIITNGLYDLNLTYNVANGGTLYTQQLILGATNLAKLTSDEIAIATSKGWTVS